MEKGKPKESTESITSYLNDLHLKQNKKSIHDSITSTIKPHFFSKSSRVPPTLLSLCLGVLGRNLEDIIDELAEVAASFPSHMKMALVAIARRRKILNDDAIIAFSDCSWEVIDISGSDVSDTGIWHMVTICKNMRAVDISRCNRLTSSGISILLEHCHSLEILRWGGCPKSDSSARRCLSLLKPNLNNLDGESWEELNTTDFNNGAQSIRWLVWPKIDKDSLETLTLECPRIIVNPKPSPLGFRGFEIPREALSEYELDHTVIKDIDPKTWAVSVFSSRPSIRPVSYPGELSIAEKFRLAFVERDTRLAPKRAKNARQHQRRSEREWVMTNSSAKALALASQANKSRTYD